MVKTVKTAVSLPEATYRKLEGVRKRLRRSRSALYAEALEEFLRAAEIREMDARYEAGYKKFPEDPAEHAAFLKAGLSTWPKEEW